MTIDVADGWLAVFNGTFSTPGYIVPCLSRKSNPVTYLLYTDDRIMIQTQIFPLPKHIL